MKVRNIEVGNLIGEGQKFRIYLGTIGNDQQVILKVAKTFEDGDTLSEEAGKFTALRTFEKNLRHFEEIKGSDCSNYNLLFANLESSFMEQTQQDRRINVLSIPEIKLDKLTPLSKLCLETEIDVRTSIWIFGRFLKFYGMFEIMKVEEDSSAARYPLFSPDDYLIGPAEHRLVYYNFSGEMYDVVAYDFVKAIAQFILNWVVIGEDSADQEYLELLRDLSENGRKTAAEAHRDLYDLVKKLWGIQYYPFTYRKRDTLNWINIKED